MTALRYGISDTLVLAKRSLLRIPRQPDLLVGFTIQPILFVLLFVYVFGGAIQTPGFDYVDFLMPGIIVQSIAFGGFVTALGLADDLKKGLMDRFRSLPITRSALLTGRTLGDVVTNIFQLVVMFTVGLLVGFDFSGSVGEVIAGIALLLLIGYAFSWVFAFIGLSSSSPEASNAYGFTILFPLTFVSSAFVPVDSMPDWLQPIAEHNPFTTMVNAARARCSSGFRRATTSGWHCSGHLRSSPSSHRSRRGAIDASSHAETSAASNLRQASDSDTLLIVLKRGYEDQVCSIARALEIVGDRWTLLIIRDLVLGLSRFDEFQESLGVASNVLTDRLGRLVDEGVLERIRYSERPERFEYRLTKKGRELGLALLALMQWGDRYVSDKPPRIARRRGDRSRVSVRMLAKDGTVVSSDDLELVPGPGLEPPRPQRRTRTRQGARR